MTSILQASCCCGGVLWYALPCSTYYDGMCCDSGCEQGSAARIEFCPEYLDKQGVPMPIPDPTKCYYFEYDCCVYVLTNFETKVCPDPTSIYPVNEGKLIRTGNKVNGLCCFAQSQDQSPVGGIGNLDGQQGPVVTEPQDPCEELIAECYTFKDQFGTVKGSEAVITCTLSACITTYGVPYYVRCDGNSSHIDIVEVTKAISQKMGYCVSCESFDGVDSPPPCTFIASCPNEKRQMWTAYSSCDDEPNCIPEDGCCGNEGICDIYPEYCDTQPDPYNTYEVKTCYSVTEGGAAHVEDILVINFPCCYATANGINCLDPQSVTAFFVNGVVSIDLEHPVNTGWGQLFAPAVTVCDLTVICFSGNAAHIAERINSRMNGFITASGIAPWSAYFWFGYRQSCVTCDWQTPNDRPPFTFGDGLSVDRAEYNATNNTIDVYIVANSPRYYACASVQLTMTYGCIEVRQAAISANGSSVPYGLDVISMPEYAFGQRYTMKSVEQIAGPLSTICIGDFVTIDVPGCEAVYGFPQNDVYLYPPGFPPVLVQEGYLTLCNQMSVPLSKCNCYPYEYTLAPCCPAQVDCNQWNIDHPIPVLCDNVFQTTQNKCTSDASIITIT
jgi:hypothetical protein